MAASLVAHAFKKISKPKDAHSDILPRFISVPGTSVPRVQGIVINQKQKGTREYEFGHTERTLRE